MTDPRSATPSPDAVLRDVFGHDRLRDDQRAVIDRTLGGDSSLVVMPTGWGKSLCFQIPALVDPEPGLTLVFSPLIALMQDQVLRLEALGIPATCINSTLDRERREARYRAMARGAFRIVYVTPERMNRPKFREAVEAIPGGIRRLAIDEAHCIAQWGHDFRPAYSQVGRYRAEIGSPPVVALTATAPSHVREEIREVLGETEASMPLFQAPLDRPNLSLEVRPALDEDEKVEEIVEVLRPVRGVSIVYVTLIRDLESLIDRLRERLPDRRFLTYHGKLEDRERKRISKAFASAPGDEDLVMVATNAFGMGIDKADIRAIIHAQVPGSIESYYQEVGRAGRDGKPSRCVLLYCSDDLRIQHEFIEWQNPPVDQLLRAAEIVATSGHGDFDEADLSRELYGRRRHDPRSRGCLIQLEKLGVLESDVIPGRFQVRRPLDPDEVDPEEHALKKRKDLERLQAVVEMTRSPSIREFLNAYFA